MNDASNSNVVSMGHNQISTDDAVKYRDAFFDEQSQIDAIMEKAREDTQPYRDQQKEIIKTAAESGIPKQTMRAAISRDKALMKAENAGSKLNPDQANEYDQLTLAFDNAGLHGKTA